MKQSNATPTMRLIKVASCPALNGKETLTYHIACNAKQESFIRLAANTGGGYFSHEWIAIPRIFQAMDEAGKAFTSAIFTALYVSKSINSKGFLLATLLHAGLVTAVKDKPHHFEKGEVACMNAIKVLMASDVSLEAS